jgi:hypothetical protein
LGKLFTLKTDLFAVYVVFEKLFLIGKSESGERRFDGKVCSGFSSKT